MLVYKGGRRQRGYGMGGVFSGFFRKLRPFLKEAALTVGRNAVETVSNVLEDVEKGDRDVVRSIKKHGKAGAIKTAKQVGLRGIKRVMEGTDGIQSQPSKRTRRQNSYDTDIFAKD